MLRPPSLQAGDKVALVSPAGSIAPEYIEHARNLLESWGLEAVIGKHALKRTGDFAGTDTERLEDLQWAMDSDDIRAIFCTRGGYGSMRIIEEADYSIFQGNPKWVIGFSDITVLHTKMTSLGIESLHAPMPKNFGDTSTEALLQLKHFLFGNISPYRLPAHEFNRYGWVKGELSGGNLCLLHCLRSTITEYHGHNTILFIEDIGENLYAIDRMMQSFKLSGRLADLQGLIVGGFTNMKGESFGKTAYEIIREAVDEYNYPLCFGFPAGHIVNNYPLIMGAQIELHVDESEGTEILFQ